MRKNGGISLSGSKKKRRRREEYCSHSYSKPSGYSILRFLVLFSLSVHCDSSQTRDFEFTASKYNYSFVENGQRVAKCDDVIRPGVPLLDCKDVEFRIVSGDSDRSSFDASSHRVGNFVFLRILQLADSQPLNRELKSHYSFDVIGYCNSPNLPRRQTSDPARIEVTVKDTNEQSPLSVKDEYEATIDSLAAPFTKVICVEASDADDGINGEVVYSIEGKNNEFMIEPNTGCILTLRSPLRHNHTTLKVRFEDRASRLFYYDDKTKTPETYADVKITVADRGRERLNVLVEKKTVEITGELVDTSQVAAMIRVEEERKEEKEGRMEVVLLDEHSSARLFLLRKDNHNMWTLLTRPGATIPPSAKVVVRAGTELATERNTTAEITIDTLERHNISFRETAYEFGVKEDLPIARVIGRVEVETVSREDEDKLSYRIEPLDAKDKIPFGIDEESGRIRVKDPLDFEMANQFKFNVLAKLNGHGHQSMVPVTVTVIDVNDVTPSFAVKFTRLESIPIPDDAKIGDELTTVTAMDKEEGANGRLTYRLIGLPPSRLDVPFKIDDKGMITLGSLLANESKWLVGVIASDGGMPSRSSQLTVGIHRNNSEPFALPSNRVSTRKPLTVPVLMDEDESFVIDEDAPIGEEIGRIPVSHDRQECLRFSTLDHHIDIDDKGLLTVSSPLSRLLPPHKEEILHSFEVTVYDVDSRSKVAKRKYAVRIRDVNDHAPVFDKPWYRVRISENTKEGTTILKVVASDEDGGDNGRVRYEVAGRREGEEDTVEDTVEVEGETGEVKLKRRLDREENEVYRLTLLAFDSGSPSRVSFVNLTIEVDDVNDNHPRCMHDLTTFRIPEDWPDGGLVGCVAAMDEDAGDNGRLQYALEMERMEDGVEPYPFRIDRHSGCVFVKSKTPLDYEKRNAYNLSIEVSDNGDHPLSTLCHLSVLLVDVNENRHAPSFEDDVLEASVYENEPIGTLVINLVVNDRDGLNANWTLEIIGGDGRAAFTIVGGDVRTTIVLDRERKADYWLTIRANDGGMESLSSHVFVYVRVLDRSDHFPLFTQPFYSVDLIENAAPETIVVKVEAEDADWPPSGRQAQLKYSIEKGDPQSLFVIDANTGYITTGGSRKLDRETQKIHDLEVRVTTLDETEANVGTTRVFVNVIDDNDNSPVFVIPNKMYEVPSGKTGRLCRVLVTDADEGDNAQLSFSLSSIHGGLTIDDDGFVSTSIPLKEGQVLPVEVTATDHGVPPRSSTTRIDIAAVEMTSSKRKKNFAPSFTLNKEYKFDASDADQVGNPVGIMTANDEDGDKLWWSVVSEDSSNYSSSFDINPLLGTVILARPIDRLPPDVNTVQLTVRVSDGVSHSDAKALISLSRQPSSRPIFSESHYKIKLSEKTPIGTSIFTPSVESFGGRPLEFGIASGESERALATLGVDPSTGSVMLLSSLDFESEQKVSVILFARQSFLSSFALLSVDVIDENDNPPVFTKSNYDVVIPFDISANSLVATVTAFDVDEGDNGLVVYDVVSGNEMGLFSIDRECGEVKTTRKLERNDHFESILTIRASDRGGEEGMLSALTTLRIRTGDMEGDVPRFDRRVYQLSVRENTPLGSLILSLSASSLDGHLRYETVKRCPWLDVHPVSGAVRLKRWLTKVRAKSINCTIAAKGRGGREATTKIVLRVKQTNEFSPVFRQQIYRGTIMENADGGSPVMSSSSNSPLIVSAFDKDSGPNGLIGYRTLQDDPYFTIDFVSGTLRSRRPLDFEKLREWRVYVVCRDMGHPPRSSSLPALVIISILDVNDNPPSFPSPSIDVDLLLPTVPGMKLTRVEAIDKDTVGEVRYYVRGNETKGLFGVDSRTGDVVVESGDRRNFTAKAYKLGILATDGVHSSSVEVRIRVKNTSNSDLRFSRSVYITHIEENLTPPTPLHLVTVSSSLSSDPAVFPVYSLLNTRQDFLISPSTGLISFIGPSIDREKEDHVLLLVEARVNEIRSQCIVRVTIGDENDNTPSFLSLPYHSAVPKGAQKGTKVVQVHTVDTDYGVNGTVSYSSSDIPSFLHLNAKSGLITVKNAVEQEQTVSFTVQASDQGSPRLTSSTTVTVDIVDSSRPRFTRRVFEGASEKSALKGRRIGKVDGKSEVEGARLVYTITKGDDDYEMDIDMDTGIVTSREVRLKKDKYELEVTVVDAIRPAMKDTAKMIVEVKSPESAALRFTKKWMKVNVSEGTGVGKEIAMLEVEGKEEGEEIVYAVEGTNASAFTIHPSGSLILVSPLDYESHRVFTLRISAERRDKTGVEDAATMTLLVQVLDSNDERPLFVNPLSSASIPDSAKAGAFVTLMSVTDKDSVSSLPGGSRLLYSVIDGDDTLFAVDKHSGVVRVGRDIEEEDCMDRKKTINVSVTDGVHTSFGRLRVDITVSGERSRPPRFEQSQYVVSTKQGRQRLTQQTLVKVGAVDGVPPLRFSLGGGESANWPVTVDHATGRIHLRSTVDKELEEAYIIPLIVSDSLGRRAFSTLTLRLIQDNEHSPEFAVNQYSSSVSSSSKPGESIIRVSAVDDDSLDTVEYAILGETHGLRIDDVMGVIRVGEGAKLLSLEGRVVSIVVRATDSGNPPHSATAQVDINVLPPTVPIPRFANSLYRFTVAEDAVVGFLVGKVQQMASEVGDVRYSMDSGPSSVPFSLDKTGKIIVQSLLDREKQSLYRFVVVARAAEGAHSSTTVVIEVDDVNDNSPVFRGNYEDISVREDAPMGTSIAVFSATDEDDGSNAKISFSLLDSESSSDLLLDSASGWLTVAKELDRERKEEYSLTVMATDEGGKGTELPVKVKIEDVNDQWPVFDEKNYTIRIDPSIVADSQTIGRVTVRDLDIPPNNISRLFITAGNEDGLFAIANSGRITLSEGGSRLLRFLSPRNFSLELLANDGVHSTTATFFSISSSADSLTECPSPLSRSLSLPQSSKPSSSLDLPPSPRKGLKYSIVSSTPSLPFEIDENTGIVTLTGVLDRGRVPEYSFIRRWTTTGDEGEVECDEMIRVEVDDDTNEGPVFEKKEYVVGVKENEKATEEERGFIVRVEAKDGNSGKKGRVRYAMVPDSMNTVFRVDEVTGVVTVVESLDREKRDEYSMIIVATDGGAPPKSAKATVRVEVADQNDNAPEFERKEYVTTVMEREAVGYAILTLKADGGDEGETVLYSLVEGHKHNHYVTLHPKTGVLTISKPLDFETDSSLSLRVIATDSGSPPLSTETTVNIEILDENDNSPVFEKKEYRMSVEEGTKKGTVLGKVVANDADSEHLGTVQYTMKMMGKKTKGEGNPFGIDEEKGEVTVKGVVDYERRNEYEMEITALDGGTPPRSSSVRLFISVLDVNDNLPLFSECNLTAVVQKSVEPGHILLTLSITDADSVKYGGPPFEMEISGEGNDALTIDRKLNIMTTKELAKMQGQRLELMVKATDGGGKSSECPLTVIVKEESRNAPKVAPLSVRMVNLYGEYTGGEVGWIEAVNEENGGMLTYSLVDESVASTSRTPHLFKVDHEKGSVWAGPGIARGIHTMNVSVHDGKFYSYAQVDIDVTSITEEMVENTMVVLVEGVTVSEFFAEKVLLFKRTVSDILNVSPDQIQLLSVVEKDRERRVPRHSAPSPHPSSFSPHSSPSPSILVAFVAHRRGSRGLMAPKQFYHRTKGDSLKHPFYPIDHSCSQSTCGEGSCTHEIFFDDRNRLRYSIVDQESSSPLTSSLVVPSFHSRIICHCPEGRGGVHCEEEVNGCSRSQCSRWQMCIPLEGGVEGKVECQCPPGTKGPRCEERELCTDHCNTTSLHVDGRAFFEVDLPSSIESSMDISIELRTTTRDGVVMYAEGEQGDSHAIEIHDGTLAYVWNAGTGKEMVESTIEIADGAWHTVWVKREGKVVEMGVDRGAKIIGEAAIGGEVVNLWRWRKTLVIGAKVVFNSSDSSIFELSRGISACIKEIRVNKKPLVLTSSGLRLFAAMIGCRELAVSPCFEKDGRRVCSNGGKCIARSDGGYSCHCPDRFTGPRCEVDDDPCGMHSGERACPPGVQCIPFPSGPQCKCPSGYTGQRCEARNPNWAQSPSACNPNPCGSGLCVDLTTSSQNIGNPVFICNCSGRYQNTACDEDGLSAFLSRYSKELIVGGVSMLIIAVLTFFIYRFCKYRNEKEERVYDDHVYAPHGMNPKVAPSTAHSTLLNPPPPLPPRSFRNRPTIEVRPYAGDERVSSSRGDSGESMNGSFGKTKNGRRRSDSTDSQLAPASCTDSSVLRDLEALRRIGLPLPDHPSLVSSSPLDIPPPLHNRRVRGRDSSSRGDAMDEEVMGLGEEWNERRRSHGILRMEEAMRNEQERQKKRYTDRINGHPQIVENGHGRITVADTLLSPLENDPEYMTMRPRSKGSGWNESQKRPLLAAAEEDESEGTDNARLSLPPPLPAHRKDTKEEDDMVESRLYDDPAYDSSIYRKSEMTSSKLLDVDNTDDEDLAPLPPDTAPPPL